MSPTANPNTNTNTRRTVCTRRAARRTRTLAVKHVRRLDPRAIPRTLPRPSLPEVNTAPIHTAHPELTGVPAEYIRKCLPLKGAQMLAALSHVSAQAPSAALPNTLDVAIRDIVPADCPTHILAVHSPAPKPLPSAACPAAAASSRRKVTLFPVHQIVLAANCSNLPGLPGRPSTVSAGSSSATLPVVPLCLPSAETYPVLQSYLYTKNISALNAVLRPSAPLSLQSLARHTVLINGLWRNACALGVVDAALWDAIDQAWGLVVDASAAR